MRSFEMTIDKTWRMREFQERVDLQLRRALAKLVMSGVPPHELMIERQGGHVVVLAHGCVAAAIVMDFVAYNPHALGKERWGTLAKVVSRYIGRWELLNA